MIGCLRTTFVRKRPIIALYFEFENELKFYNLEGWIPTFSTHTILNCDVLKSGGIWHILKHGMELGHAEEALKHLSLRWVLIPLLVWVQWIVDGVCLLCWHIWFYELTTECVLKYLTRYDISYVLNYTVSELFACWVIIVSDLLSSADFSKIIFFKKSFRNTIKMSNRFGSRRSVLICRQTVCKSYQQTT